MRIKSLAEKKLSDISLLWFSVFVEKMGEPDALE